jgi:hypothetical protein
MVSGRVEGSKRVEWSMGLSRRVNHLKSPDHLKNLHKKPDQLQNHRKRAALQKNPDHRKNSRMSPS